MGFEPVPLGYTPIVRPIKPREHARLASGESNTLDTHFPAPLWNTSMHYETLKLLSVGLRLPPGVCTDLRWVGRGVPQKDER